MRKIISVCFIVLSSSLAAQSLTSNKLNNVKSDLNYPKQINSELKNKNYNHWSVNFNAGFNKPVGSFTSGYVAGYSGSIKDLSFNHFGISSRKMFNTKFGLLLGLDYDNFSNVERSRPFSNNMYSMAIQGVINVHRALNWQEFTNTFGLQLHFGPGLSFLENNIPKNNSNIYSSSTNLEYILNATSGATILLKISEHLMVNLDYSMIKNFSQYANFDGTTKVDIASRDKNANYAVTAGVTLYLGKKEKHADWYYEQKSDNSNELLARMENLESQLKDSNMNGFPDMWETYVKQTTTKNSTIVNNAMEGDQYYTTAEARNMINSQYVNVFFDFDQSKITTGTISSIFFLIKYLNSNPTLNVDVIGYSDEFGNPAYNLKLSETRAKNVAEMIMRAGIDASRLKIVIKGEDNSVPKESELARQLVRRVAFKVY